MAEIVNLNRFRKARARQSAKAEAEENRLQHGRTKAEKLRNSDERNREAGSLDGAKLDDDDGAEPA